MKALNQFILPSLKVNNLNCTHIPLTLLSKYGLIKTSESIYDDDVIALFVKIEKHHRHINQNIESELLRIST